MIIFYSKYSSFVIGQFFSLTFYYMCYIVIQLPFSSDSVVLFVFFRAYVLHFQMVSSKNFNRPCVFIGDSVFLTLFCYLFVLLMSLS